MPIASYRGHQRSYSRLLILAHSVPSFFPSLKSPRGLVDALSVCFTGVAVGLAGVETPGCGEGGVMGLKLY
jgi:hypothetical protein